MERKRQKIIQKNMDAQVLQEAATEAWLEESMMETEVVSKEQLMFDSHRKIIRWQMQIDAAKKKNELSMLANKVDSALNRFAYARESLQQQSAQRIQEIEDTYSRDQAVNERKLRQLAEEEEAKLNNHKLNRMDHRIFHTKDVKKAEDELVTGIQASETEEQLSDDEDPEDEDDDEDEQDE
jgi:hypothetical protein